MMPVTSNEKAFCAITAIAAIGLVWYAYQQTDSKPVPQNQREWQMMGMGITPDTPVRAGSPLDASHYIHGYHPGFDPDPSAQPVVQSRVRYPAVPGGNLSTVMHKGWSSVNNDSPAGNDWLITPPEAAVI